MFDVLHRVIEELPDLLKEKKAWRSVHVTYHAPRVERIWRQHGDHRILLHRIYPCEPGEALAHPHPWPSAVRVMSGSYEHQSGDSVSPGFHAMLTTILPPGAEYEMTDRYAWHSVRPLEGPSDSIMVTGPLYTPRVVMPTPPTEKQHPLSPARFDELFAEWVARFDGGK